MTSVPNPKELVYDAQISPLVTQIIDLCREAKINMFATFALDRGEDDAIMWCTTAQPENDPEDTEGSGMVDALRRVVRPSVPTFAAFTITRGR